jgi:hypothetical protein
MDTQKLIKNSKSSPGLAAFDRELKHCKSNGNVNARIKGGKMYKIIANNCKKAGTICGISFLFQALFQCFY